MKHKPESENLNLLNEVKNQRSHIQTDSYTTSWGEIINQYRDAEILIDPEYQRLFRWDYYQQTCFIESLLLDLPTPAVFVAINQDGKNEVIDGLQRISTVLKFFAPMLNAKKTRPSKKKPDMNDILVPTTLQEGPLLKSLKGASFQSLPSSLALGLKRARVTVVFLKKESSPVFRYEVFKRLNTFGTHLSPQEIRNCTARIFSHDFANSLHDLANQPQILSAFGFPITKIRKRAIDELLLRLLAFNHHTVPFEHGVSEYLNDFMAHAAQGNFEITKEIRGKLLNTFELIGKTLPNGKAFRFREGPKLVGGFSTNLFDIVATGVYRNISTIKAAQFVKRHARLFENRELDQLTGAGSNTRVKIEGRVKLGKTWFAK